MRSNLFSSDFRVLILAPTPKDAQVTTNILRDHSIVSLICRDVNHVCAEIEHGADAAIITEEAILSDGRHCLENILKNQAPWSDFPLIVLTPASRESPLAVKRLQAIGNMTLVARPVQIAALVSTVQTALRDRKRQYRIRDYLMERDAQAAEIQAIRDHLELMLESARDFAIISMDQQGHIVSWNSGAHNIFGYRCDEVLERSFSLIFTPEDCEANRPEEELRIAARRGHSPDERWHMRKDGERFYCSGITAAMLGDDGSVKGFIKIARDRTEEKKAEEALIAARNAAEAANIAKSEFLANMSHEIRTPMNAVIGLANILAISQPLTQKQMEYIKTLQLSADSLLALINDLLDISKIEACSVELEQVPFSLTDVLQEVMRMIVMRVQEKELSLTSEEDAVDGYIFIGDPVRIRQILMNLISNAVKFTEKGGIHIRLASEQAETPDTLNVSIAVEDTGIGIAPDKLETIFEKFVQADSSINRKYGGTGLGLAITKTLAEIMGGTITVESTQGKGSVFTFCVPLKIASDADIRQSSYSLPEISKHSASRTAANILLVEDNTANILVAKTFLEQFGYRCKVASNGMEAVEMFKNESFAGLLMDVQMHGMNGLEATRLIREYERPRNMHVPIIGMTAHVMTGDRERCLEAGMDDYIAKPFNPEELKAKLHELLRRVA